MKKQNGKIRSKFLGQNEETQKGPKSTERSHRGPRSPTGDPMGYSAMLINRTFQTSVGPFLSIKENSRKLLIVYPGAVMNNNIRSGVSMNL